MEPSERSSPSRRLPPGDPGPTERDDIDFLAETAAAHYRRPPGRSRVILWTVAAFLLSAIAWASWAELDQVTRGQGKVIPSRQVQVIQNLEGGIVSELKVGEGDIVDEGQVLLRIDDTRFASTYKESRLHYLALRAKAARLAAEARGEPYEAPEEILQERPELAAQERRLYEARQEELQAQLEILKERVHQREQDLKELQSKETHLAKSLQLASRELKLTRPLMESGAVSEVEILRLERQVNDQRGELEATRLAISGAKSRLEEAKKAVQEGILGFRNKAREQLNEVRAQLAGVGEANIALEDRVERTAVRSPVRGTVKQLFVNTVGGVVQPGMDLVEVVPLEDSLLVEARIRPSDIAFLHPGQKAVVKFSAYDFAIYGGLEARLEQISADTITTKEDESYYRVRVRTDKGYLGTEQNKYPIIPGMTATVDILTGKKTVLEYLLKPVLRAKEYALRGRSPSPRNGYSPGKPTAQGP